MGLVGARPSAGRAERYDDVIIEGFVAQTQQPRRQPLDRPVSGIVVQILDPRAVHDGSPLGPAMTTDANGRFSATFGTTVDTKRLSLRIRTWYGRTLVVKVTDSDITVVSESDDRLVVIIWLPVRVAQRSALPAATAHGFVLPDLPVTVNRVLPLVDNEAAWTALTQAVETAAADTPIELMELSWKEKLYTSFDVPPQRPDEPKRPVSGKKLEDVLVARSKAKPFVPLRFLFHSGMESDVADDVRKRVTDAGAPGIVVKGFTRPATAGVVHSKGVTIGDTAYLLGSPLWQHYLDGPRHRIDDGRRGKPVSKLHFYYFVSVPVHEVSLAVQGPAVETLRKHFFQCWNNAGSSGSSDSPGTPAPSTPTSWSTAAVQIARTMPGFQGSGKKNTIPDLVPDGEKDILDAYLYAIQAAKRFIYLENQYFIETQIGDALLKALKRNPELRVIIVINVNTDIPTWYGRQLFLILEMKRRATAAGTVNRLFFYTLWSHEVTSTGTHILMRTYVHAKAAVIDDRWATIGSANLDEISLDSSPTFAAKKQERALEVNAFLFNGVDGQPASTVPERLRRQLWAEHLGFTKADGTPDPDDPRLDLPAGTDPSAQWTARAVDRIAALKVPNLHAARILPWNLERSDKNHVLTALGVKKLPRTLTVQEQFRGYDLETSEWL